MTINQIADFCTKTVGDTSSDAVEFAKTAVRLKYKTLYDSHAWRESFRLVNIILDPALSGVFFLPYDAEEMIFCKLSRDSVNYQRLQYRDRDWIERAYHSAVTLPGYTPFYYRSENLAWPYLNPNQLTFTSYDLTPFTIFIEGRDGNNNPISEAFILNGVLQVDGITVTPGIVTTAKVYKVVTSLSKGGGTLQIVDSQGLSMSLGAASAALVFSQFVLYPPLTWTDTDGTPIPYTVQCQVKLKADSLDNDMSVPRVSHIWDALIEFTLASLYTRARSLTKADSREAKAIAHIQAAVNVEKNQSESFQQVQPTIYDSGDYLACGYSNVSSINPFG